MPDTIDVNPSALISARRVLGGVATVAIALIWMKLFPSLRAVERLE